MHFEHEIAPPNKALLLVYVDVSSVNFIPSKLYTPPLELPMKLVYTFVLDLISISDPEKYIGVVR